MARFTTEELQVTRVTSYTSETFTNSEAKL